LCSTVDNITRTLAVVKSTKNNENSLKGAYFRIFSFLFSHDLNIFVTNITFLLIDVPQKIDLSLLFPPYSLLYCVLKFHENYRKGQCVHVVVELFTTLLLFFSFYMYSIVVILPSIVIALWLLVNECT
jgi:prolipoprotein diacylglyceryltransferase